MRIIKADTAEIGTSVIGAIILGAGIGGLFARYLALSFTISLIVIGIAFHGLGMYQLHRREKESSDKQFFLSNILYGLCWILLAVLIVYFLVRIF